MIVLERSQITDERPSHDIVTLFGAGLIGRSILVACADVAAHKLKQLPFCWHDQDKRVQDAECLERHITKLAGTSAGTIARVNIVWAAGRAGFASSPAETEQELTCFREVLALAERLCGHLPEACFAFHLISSAGGLFEGQRLVGWNSIPQPRRPYGELKLAQENLLSRSRAPLTKFIYRPSSVYGFAGEGLRLGLVGVLARDAIRHRVSRIFGAPTTLRDYVFAADVGCFVARQLNRNAVRSEVFLLANGKPSSIFEVVRRIEQAVGRRPYVQFDTHPSSIEQNSYRPSALPKGWWPTTLDTGIRRTVSALKQAIAMADTLDSKLL